MPPKCIIREHTPTRRAGQPRSDGASSSHRATPRGPGVSGEHMKALHLMTWRGWCFCAAVVLWVAGWALAAAAAQPAVLVVSPQGTAGVWLDMDYLNELHQAGFEVDYTESMADVTWNRLQRYNVLVLYTCPPAPGVDAWPFSGSQPIYKTDFIALIERFLAQGGGVLLMAVETNVRVTLTRDMITRWGADLPMETITDPTNTKPMSRMPTVPLAYTNQITASPVSAGVQGIWYPVQPDNNAAHTLPLWVDGSWQVVVRAMPTARTVPVDLNQSPYPAPPNPLIRPGGVPAPPLFAIRQYGAGRLALLSQWPTYSLGSGTKWLYNREVLSQGLNGKPSGFGRLLQNSFRWLAQPSLQSKTVGGYVTPAQRLVPPNLQPPAKQGYQESVWNGEDPTLRQPPKGVTLFKGLIGAQTSLSGGQGTVADYAAAARAAGLDFLVFLEDFANLSDAELNQLKADCAQNSDAQLTLYAGYRIDNNIGNHLFLFGPGVVMPPPRVLTGANGKTLILQGESSPGVFGVAPAATQDFLLSLSRNAQIGYYDFAHSGMGMRLEDARLYSMIGLRTYRNGQLIDDATAAYLTTAQATISPAPAAIQLVTSPAALTGAVTVGQGLTYAMARSASQLWADALGYSSQYSCPNVFTSDGPQILRWPACVRVSTYGAESFVTGRSLMEAPIYVTSAKGLAEIQIYDGGNLYRRFKLNGDPVFSTLLHLDGSVQRNLVLIAQDTAGGRAVSFARRNWKDGSRAPVFCSDRINDCAYMYLAHGPFPMTVLRTPEIADPGSTWDGGPRGILTPITFEGSNPLLTADAGQMNGDQYNQTPLLEFADEGAVAVRSIRNELIDERVRVQNPWNTFGPRTPSRLMDFSLSYAEFDRPSIGVPPMGWAAPPVQSGCSAALFRGSISFKQALTANSLRLLRDWHWIPSLPLHLVVGSGATVLKDIDLGSLASVLSFTLASGDWFGLYSQQTANSQLFINRGGPLQLQVSQPPGVKWLSLSAAMANPQVTAGQKYQYELLSVGCPLDAAAHSASALAAQRSYLTKPTGANITRGRRLNTPGAFEVQPSNYAMHLAVPRPTPLRNLTLPVMVDGLNRRWSAGLWQLNGFVKGDYGTGANRYRAVGLDLDGRAYVPLYPDLAAVTEVEVGHPVIADARGQDLFIQVTALSGGTVTNPQYQWAVAVNNPTDNPITTVLTQNMALPDFSFGTQSVTLAPGEQRVLSTSTGSAGPLPTAPQLAGPDAITAASPTATATRAQSPTFTATRTALAALSPTPSRTSPPSPTPTTFRTATLTRTATPTSTPTPTPSP